MNKYDDFNKVKKVFESCNTLQQLQIANQYAKLFLEKVRNKNVIVDYDHKSFLAEIRFLKLKMQGKILY